MSDLSGKTITLPAELGVGGVAIPCELRDWADALRKERWGVVPSILTLLADEIERQHPPRMDEPDEFGAMVEAATDETGRERWLCGEPITNPSEPGKRWWRNEHGDLSFWRELIGPRPVD